MPVPEAFTGVWQRTLLTNTAGLHDTTTRVFWLQTLSGLYADLRIPEPTPAAGAASLEQCDAAALAQLTTQEGFAGVSEVNGDVCQWHRHIDFQPPGGPPDIGKIKWISEDKMDEDGLDDSYHEVWERLPGSKGETAGVKLTAGEGNVRSAFVVVAGEYFLFAADRYQPLAEGLPLAQRVEAAADPLPLLQFELAFGRCKGEDGTPWKIELSSLPGRVGASLLPADITPGSLTSADKLVVGVYAPEGGWTVVR